MTDEMKAKREKLFSSAKNGYDLVDQAALDAMEAYCETYKQYLDNGKTERECAAYTVELAQAQGYVPLSAGHEPEARRQGVPREPGQERDAGQDRPPGPVPRRADRGLPH